MWHGLPARGPRPRWPCLTLSFCQGPQYYPAAFLHGGRNECGTGFQLVGHGQDGRATLCPSVRDSNTIPPLFFMGDEMNVARASSPWATAKMAVPHSVLLSGTPILSRRFPSWGTNRFSAVGTLSLLVENRGQPPPVNAPSRFHRLSRFRNGLSETGSSLTIRSQPFRGATGIVSPIPRLLSSWKPFT